MSTPTTATLLQTPHHHFSPHYANYQPHSTTYLPHIQSHSSKNPHLDQHQQRTASRNSQNFSSNRPESSNEHGLLTSRDKNSTMSTQKKTERQPNWDEFYKNGRPSEVIMIHDDTPESQWDEEEASYQQTQNQHHGDDSSRHTDKRRRVGAGVDSVYSQASSLRSQDSYQASNSSKATVSTDRTNSSAGSYSTSGTSYSSLSNGSQRLEKPASSYTSSSQAGQKRKRSARDESGDEDFDIKIIRQHRIDWPQYHPPPKPPKKAKDVNVRVVQRERALAQGQKVDDEDGHYIVVPNTELTKKYTIVRLLGQGTFGKVVEALDRETGQKCAIKIIRAVPKYRDASRIELRVLDTLAQNDRENRNRCIHLRECFDYMNHICIVTDLLSQSVFDFLKNNEFVPFPSSHIQKFAWQLFTSVAFLHDLNLIHTDLKPENILLVDKGYQTFTYNRTIPSSSRGTSRVAKQRRVLLDTKIRLIDFGSATFEDEYHSSVVSTRHYRAPEIILNLGWSFPCDIWSIGCILVEFFTGDALFQTHDNLEHLAMMEAVCDAKIPREIIEKVRAGYRSRTNGAAAYFRPKAFALDYPQTETSKASKKYVKGMKKLCDTIPPNTEFNRQFLDLLQRIFVYDPKKRISAHDALRHPWFQEKIIDDGTEADKIRMHKERSGYR